MGNLVAISLPPSARFVDQVRAIWDVGDAVLPLDHRLPSANIDALLQQLRPSALITADGCSSLMNSRPVEADDALVIATSGTSGAHKGVVLTHHALETAARITTSALGVTATDSWLLCLPLAFIGGFSVITRAFYSEVPLIVHEEFAPAAVARSGASLVSLVPTQLRRLTHVPFRHVLLGGAAPLSALPDNVISTYGMTETAGGIVYNGRALDSVDVRLDSDGRISLLSPTLARAYRFADHDDVLPVVDGWFQTADVGTLDQNGVLHVLGRIDDCIISGGEKVWPSVVERELCRVSGVIDAAVYGAPDDEWGQRVVAMVQTSQPLEPEEIRTQLSDHLPPSCIPKALYITDAILRNANGKLLRRP